VVLIKQEKVPCLIDNDAHLALDPSDAYAVQTKPHGHGDVHGLLHRSGLAQHWQQQGLQWVCFFQVRDSSDVGLLWKHYVNVTNFCSSGSSRACSGCASSRCGCHHLSICYRSSVCYL
jgi:hypothetical protein